MRDSTRKIAVLRLTGVLLLCLMSLQAVALEVDANLQNALENYFPKAKVYLSDEFWSLRNAEHLEPNKEYIAFSQVEGKLDKQNKEYVVVDIVKYIYQKNSMDSDVIGILVFVKAPNNSYKVAASTGFWESGSQNGRNTWHTEIKNESIFLLFENNPGHPNALGGLIGSNTTLQFKKYGQKFLLIGAEEDNYELNSNELKQDAQGEITSVPINPIRSDSKKSINFLTRTVIHKYESFAVDKNSTDFEKLEKKKIKNYIEKKLKFEISSLLELDGFNFDKYSDIENKTKNVCGYIRADGKFDTYEECKME